MSGNKNTDAKRKYFALPDLMLLAVVLCAAFFGIINLFVSRDTGELTAVVRVSGEVYEEIPLSQVKENYSLTIKGKDGKVAVLLVTSDKVLFTHSECPDKLCVNTGELSKSGDSAVCLPLRISVKLVSDDSAQSGNTPDVIVG